MIVRASVCNALSSFRDVSDPKSPPTKLRHQDGMSLVSLSRDPKLGDPKNGVTVRKANKFIAGRTSGSCTQRGSCLVHGLLALQLTKFGVNFTTACVDGGLTVNSIPLGVRLRAEIRTTSSPDAQRY